MSDDYNPNSWDAVTAKIISKLENQDSKLENQDRASEAWRTEFMSLLKATKEGVDKTNGRVTALERDKWFQRGFVAAISLGATAAWQWWTGHK